jgi:hypothetical protein
MGIILTLSSQNIVNDEHNNYNTLRVIYEIFVSCSLPYSVDPNLLGQDCVQPLVAFRAKTGIWQSPRSKNWIY